MSMFLYKKEDALDGVTYQKFFGSPLIYWLILVPLAVFTGFLLVPRQSLGIHV
jgi:hypothetical protein